MYTVFLHGAASTPICYNYIRSKLLLPEEVMVTYKIENGLRENVSDIKKLLQDRFKGEPINLIGHSMGGLMAVLLHQEGIVINKMITISAPFGFNRGADLLRVWSTFTGDRLIADLGDKKLFATLKEKSITVPHISMVSTNGYNPIYNASKLQNDGVVTVDSQKNIPNLNYKEYPYNHSEILLADDVVEDIRKFLL